MQIELNQKESKKVSDLTIQELKDIIRQIIREEIPHGVDYTPCIPQPIQYKTEKPKWMQEVICETVDRIKMEKPGIEMAIKQAEELTNKIRNGEL